MPFPNPKLTSSYPVISLFKRDASSSLFSSPRRIVGRPLRFWCEVLLLVLELILVVADGCESEAGAADIGRFIKRSNTRESGGGCRLFQ